MSYAVPCATGHHEANRDRAARESIETAPVETGSVETAPVVRRSRRRRLAGLVMNGVLLLCVLVFLLIALGPHLFGYRTATMLTGSMEPGIMPGDVVVTVPKPTADLKVGDVITYQIPVEDHRVETHRVTKVIHNPDGTIAIRTKGDNNASVDPWTATLDDNTVWETAAVVPKLGVAIRALRSPVFQHGAFWLAFGGLILMGLNLIWGSKKKSDGSPEGPGDDTNDCTNDDTGTGSDDAAAQDDRGQRVLAA